MFRLREYPATVRQFFKKAPILWPSAITEAIEGGIEDVDKLTDFVFYMHHKERVSGGIGQPLKPSEPNFRKLSAEWSGFKTMVAPMMKQLTESKSKGVIASGSNKTVEKRPSEIQALTGKEIKLFVWAVIGEPTSVSAVKQAKEFMEFTGLKSFLKKPSVVSGAKVFFKAYKNAMLSHFTSNPESKWGMMVGMTYSMLDEATDARKTRRRPGKTRRQKLFAEGFKEGYGDMRSHLAQMGDDEALRKILKQLSLVKPRTKSMRNIYGAIYKVTEPLLSGSKDIMYMFAREDCKFGYPNFRVDKPLKI